MMEFLTFLWCDAFKRTVRVVLERTHKNAPHVLHVPVGWRMKICVDKGRKCNEAACPLLDHDEIA